MLLLCQFEFLNTWLDLSFFACLMMVPSLKFRQYCSYFVISSEDGLLEYWIRSYVRGHWFGCSLQPGMLLYSPCQDVGFICLFVAIDPTYLGATTAVARNLLQD